MDKITKIHHHDIQLKSVRVISLNSFISSDLNDDNTEVINVETSIGNFGEVLSDTKGKSFLKTKVEGTNEGLTIFEIEVVYEGLCESIERVDKDEFEFFLEVQSVPMLWSYTRETINNMMLKMNLKPILLPVLNINEIMTSISKSREGVWGENSDE